MSLRAFKRLWQSVVDGVKQARKVPPKPSEPTPLPDGAVGVQIEYDGRLGPVVESPDIKTPLPLAQVPARSTRGDAKRHAKRVIEQRTNKGKPLTNKQVKKRIKKILRKDRDAQVKDVADPKKRSTLPVED